MEKVRFRNDPKFFSDECDIIVRPGDDIERIIKLKPELKWERKMMAESSHCSRDQILAFTFANKADAMMDIGMTPMALDFAFRAFKLDPMSVDAIRVMCRVMQLFPQVDVDTIICLFREMLFTYRRFLYIDELYLHAGDSYKFFKLRGYTRALYSLGQLSISNEINEVAVYAFEEILRCDHEDIANSRGYLIISYFKIIGRLKHSENYPIKRTAEHLKSFLEAKLPLGEGPLFENENNQLPNRWNELLINRYNNNRIEEFESMAKEEEKRNPELIKLIFEETKINFVTMAETKKYGEPLCFSLYEWPDFVIALHTLLRKDDKEFNLKVNCRIMPYRIDSSCREYKSQMASMGTDFLDRGRNAFRQRNVFKAITLFTMGKRYYVEAMKPSQRWYLNAPFALVSNRGSCAESCMQWQLTRHDTRFTLSMQPDHLRSYERLPRIAEAFGALDLKKRLEDFVKNKVRIREESTLRFRTMREWRTLANEAIALISLTAIVSSRLGMLNDEVVKELVAVGIEDMYTPCNVGLNVMPPVPWLENEELECV